MFILKLALYNLRFAMRAAGAFMPFKEDRMKRCFVMVSLLFATCLVTPLKAGKWKEKGWAEVSIGSGSAVYTDEDWIGTLKLLQSGVGFSPPIGLGVWGGWEFADNLRSLRSGGTVSDTSEFNPYYYYGGPFLRFVYTPYIWWGNYVGARFDVFLEGNASFGTSIKTGIWGSFLIGEEEGLMCFLKGEGGYQKYYGTFLPFTGPYFAFSVGVGSGTSLGSYYKSSDVSGYIVKRYCPTFVKPSSKVNVPVRILPTGDYGIRESSITGSLPEGLSVPGPVNSGRLGKNKSRNMNIPIEVEADVVPGWKTIRLDFAIVTKDGSRNYEKDSVRIRVVSAAAKPVAVIGMQKENLCDLILPVSEPNAEYRAEYSNKKLTILNLVSGQKTEVVAVSQNDAVKALNAFFEGEDQSPPVIALSVRDGETVPAESLQVALYLSDDQLLSSLRVVLNDKQFVNRGLSASKEDQLSIVLPLEWGDNKLKIEAKDAVGNITTEELTVTRIRGTGVAGVSDVTIPSVDPPLLTYALSSSSGTNTLVGGTVGGVVAIVHNRGKGNAQRVKISLTGDDELCKLLGRSKDVALIESGDSTIVEFTKFLPTDLECRTANLKVSVTEGRGYSPIEVKSLSLNLVPATRTQTEVELVEDVDHDIPTSGLRRDGYALIVGITDYQYTPGPAFARHDAEIFRNYAEKVLGIPAANIKLLTNNTATGGMITAQLKDWLGKKSGFKVIYFAGHGVPDPENPRSGQAFLLPHDGDPELKSTLISVADLAKLAGSNKDTILVILDACFSGGGEGRTPELAQRPVVLATIPEEQGIYLAAAEGTQAAKDYTKAQHGYFTYYLLLGLRGQADANSDGWITTGELHRFVHERVLDVTNNLQEPVLRPQVEVEIGKWK